MHIKSLYTEQDSISRTHMYIIIIINIVIYITLACTAIAPYAYTRAVRVRYIKYIQQDY